MHTKHLFRENHEGLRLGCPSFTMITVSGPLGWLLSQILLLAYFKLDNGSNVCGLEFDFDNKGAREKTEEKKENEEEENSTNDSEATNTSSADQSESAKGDAATSSTKEEIEDSTNISNADQPSSKVSTNNSRASHESGTKEDDTKSKGDDSTSTSEDKPSDIEDIESRLVCSSSCLKKMLLSDFEATTEEGR